MSSSGLRPPIRTPTNPGSFSAGASITSVVVQSVDPKSSPPVAVCADAMGRPLVVRIDFQRGKGSIPAPGETWVIDQSLGFWTFNCIQNTDPEGTASISGTHAIAGLDESLNKQNAALDDSVARLDEMWTLATITAVQGTTTADVKLSDGTVFSAIPVVGTYAPGLNEVVWTVRVDAAGSRVIIGPSAYTAGDTYGYNADFYKLNVRSGATTLGGTLAVEGTTNLSGRLTATTANFSGRIDAYELWTSGGMRSLGGLSCVGNFIGDANGEVALRMTANNFEVTGNSVFSRSRDGAIRWNSLGDTEFVRRDGSGYRDIYFWLPKQQAPSWRRLKTNITPYEQYLGGSASEIVGNLEIAGWVYDLNVAPDIQDVEEHFGPMLDGLPPKLIQRTVRADGEDRSTYDRDGVVGLALAAIQEHRAEIIRLREQIVQLKKAS